MPAQDCHILVVSTKVDLATDVVIGELARLGVHYTRINTEDFPFHSELTVRYGIADDALPFHYSYDGIVGEPKSLYSAVWYRRIRSPVQPDQMESGVYEFCLHEARGALIGSVLAHQARFMSFPSAIWAAEYKPYQLQVARSVGLPIPNTVITNSPSAVQQAFQDFHGRMIIKPVRTGYIDYGTEQHTIYTSRVLKEHLQHVDAARLSPSIYQELLDKLCDVRVTIVGRELFVAEIDSQSDPAASLDWRRTANPKLPHRQAELPGAVCDRLLSLMDKLNLAFGAIDLVRTVDGRYVFLEVNPSGQWLWLDDFLDFGIAHYIAQWLIGDVA